MKKNLYFAVICVALALMTACSSFSNRGTVDKPMIGAANQENMSFDKIELTDSSTVIYGSIHYRPGWWIRLASGSVIIADGVSYPVESFEGLEPDTQVTLPESGELDFTMTFPAIPSDVRSIDFSENTEGGWQIWDIDLTGKADHGMYQAKVPSKLKNDTSRPMPETVIAYGDSATINVHILGYRPEMGNKMRWYINTPYGQIGTDTPAEVDAEGNATVRLSISTPVHFSLIGLDNLSALSSGGIIVAPGETVNVYVDPHISGLRNMATRDGGDLRRPEGYFNIFADGVYPVLQHNIPNSFGMEFYSGRFGDYHMNGDEYTAYILDTFNALNDSINSSATISEMGRSYSKAMLMADLVYAAANARQMMMRNYYYANQVPFGSPIPTDSISLTLTPDNLKTIAEHIDFNNPDILLSDNMMSNMGVDMWENAGVDPGLLKTVSIYRKAYNAAENGELEDSGLAEQLRARNSALADEVVAHDAAIKARIEALGTDLMTPTPDVAPDKVFDAIIAPHKGKVVMVDLWNTWCGPCRAALAANEPEKSGDLSSEDIVWIYLANQTSPQVKYMMMINDIKGIHYRLEDEQWAAICKRFNVDGIPFYILVDREGNAQGRPDLRDHSEFKKALLAEVDKK